MTRSTNPGIHFPITNPEAILGSPKRLPAIPIHPQLPAMSIALHTPIYNARPDICHWRCGTTLGGE
ncbi:hypothetical protein PCASD_13752 [Puccinia coronata f. sp. avenae]|uniref:Uncharacterized protein n=1 Tax=Puccinia coronata f. sp. avenae TaxID=200324 RepID=A0A2N5UL93_9BASI|nr:hypothetical protein PCASD_13752 [Puccinia coronata f. sp. avenae]